MGTITAIIPFYNAERWVRESLPLVERTVLPYADAVLVDDGSTDETPSALREFAARHSERVRVISLGANRGVATARNVALATVDSEYVWFADADDWWLESLLPTLLERAIQTDADICLCRARRVTSGREAGTVIDGVDVDTVWDREEALRALLDGRMHGYLWSKLFRVSVLGQDPFPPLTSQSDFMGVLVALRSSSIVATVATDLYRHVERPGSITRVSNPNLDNLLVCLEAMQALLCESWVSSDARSLFDYFTLWFYILPVVDIPLRFAADRGVVRQSLHVAREKLRRISLLRLLRRRPALAIRGCLVLVLGPLYPMFFRALRATKDLLAR